MPRRRFPPPWDIEERNAACFIVMDANRFPVCYVYFESEPARRTAANLLTPESQEDSGQYRQAAGAT
jgi:hypothetical protein